MLRPKSVVDPRRLGLVVAPLAFVLSMGISHQAFAACAPSDTISGTVANVVCDPPAADDDLEVTATGVVTNDVNLKDGKNEATIEGIVGHDILGGTGEDTIKIEGGSVGRGPDGPEGAGPNTGTINTGADADSITIDDGGHVQNIDMGAGNDKLTQTEGEIHGSVQMGSGADAVEIHGGEVHSINMGDSDGSGAGFEDRLDFEGNHGEEIAIEGNSTVIQGGAGDHRMRFIGLNNLEEDEENFEINENARFDGGTSVDDYDRFIVEDDSEVRFGNQLLNFEYFSVQEESIAVLTGTTYKFSDASAVPLAADKPIGINVGGDSQLWFESSATIEAPHIEIQSSGPGDLQGSPEPLKVSNQYAAFDPGGILMFGHFLDLYEEAGEEEEEDEGGPGEPVDTTVNIGPNTVVNAGTMGMFNGIAGDRVEFVGGGYESDNNTGKFVIDTKLGGSNSLTDRFDFDPAEDVDGLTTIYVNNAGGTGAFTGHGVTDGIVIVTGKDGFGPTGSFQLGVNLTGRREVLAGAFSYQLRTFGGNVVLQSDVLDQVPAYTVASSASQRFASTGLGTLYKRLGEVRLGHANDQALAGGGSMWARGLYGDYDIDPQQGYGFSQKTDGVLMGVDAGVVANEGGGRWLFGLFGGYGNSDVDVTATIWGQNSASKLDLTGWSAGGYGTYWESGRPGTGYYFDGVFKADILNYDVTSAARSTSASTDGYAGTVSGETGYGFAFGGNLTLQPQAQLSYTSVSITNYTDSYGIKVGNGTAESLIGRASLQLQGNYGSGNSGWFAPYIIASVLSDFLGDNETLVAATPFQNDMGLTWFEAGGGVTAELSNSISLYGSAEYSVGDVEGWGGTGGVKARW